MSEDNGSVLIKERRFIPRQNFTEVQGYKLNVEFHRVYLENGNDPNWVYGDPMGTVTLKGPYVKITVGDRKEGYYNLRSHKQHIISTIIENFIYQNLQKGIKVQLDAGKIEEMYDEATKPYMNLVCKE
jgi:hypothetical protein